MASLYPVPSTKLFLSSMDLDFISTSLTPIFQHPHIHGIWIPSCNRNEEESYTCLSGFHLFHGTQHLSMLSLLQQITECIPFDRWIMSNCTRVSTQTHVHTHRTQNMQKQLSLQQADFYSLGANAQSVWGYRVQPYFYPWIHRGKIEESIDGRCLCDSFQLT